MILDIWLSYRDTDITWGGMMGERELLFPRLRLLRLVKPSVWQNFEGQKSSWAICLLKTLWLPHGLGCSSRPPTSTICLIWALPTSTPKASVLFFLTFGTISSHSSIQQAHGWLMAQLCDSASTLLQSREANWPCALLNVPGHGETSDRLTLRQHTRTLLRCISTACSHMLHTVCQYSSQIFPLRKIQLIPYTGLPSEPKI